MHLRKSLGVITVALLVLGALGASASAGTAKTKPKPAAKHKVAKKTICTLGQDLAKHTCLPNPLYATSACDSLEPALSAIVGGPLHPQHPNPGAAETQVSCAFFAGSDYRATVYVYDDAVSVAYDRAHPSVASSVEDILATDRKWAAAPLSLLQTLLADPNQLPPSGYLPTGQNICYVDTGDWEETPVPYDAPRLLAGLGDLAFVWDVCTAAVGGAQPCPQSAATVPTLPAPCLESGERWQSQLLVKRGNAAYEIIVPRPAATATDDQLAAFVKTLMAKYH